MKIKLNVDLNGRKAGQILEFERLKFHDQVYFSRRIEDSKIDKCVEVLSDDVVAEDSAPAPSNSDKPSKSKRKTGE